MVTQDIGIDRRTRKRRRHMRVIFSRARGILGFTNRQNKLISGVQALSRRTRQRNDQGSQSSAIRQIRTVGGGGVIADLDSNSFRNEATRFGYRTFNPGSIASAQFNKLCRGNHVVATATRR